MDCAPQLHLAAWHSAPGYHSAVPGIGVLCRESDYLGGAGVFSNSVGRTSAYAIMGAQPWRVGGVRVGAFAGFATGYRKGVVPVAAGYVTFGNGVSLTLVPRIKNVTPATVGFSLEF
jgi:hypothetical protein